MVVLGMIQRDSVPDTKTVQSQIPFPKRERALLPRNSQLPVVFCTLSGLTESKNINNNKILPGRHGSWDREPRVAKKEHEQRVRRG